MVMKQNFQYISDWIQNLGWTCEGWGIPEPENLGSLNLGKRRGQSLYLGKKYMFSANLAPFLQDEHPPTHTLSLALSLSHTHTFSFQYAGLLANARALR